MPAHRLVVAAHDHVGRGADQRDDHAAADEHRAGGGRHPVVAGDDRVPRRALRPVRGRHRLDPVLPRALRLRLRAPPAWTGQDLPMLPSELFRERFITCFIDDAAGIAQPARRGHRPHHLGVRLPALRLDVARLTRAAAPSRSTACSDAEIDAITHENAMRLFHYDPFSVIPKEQATVGALRAEADRRRHEHQVVGQAGPPARQPRSRSSTSPRCSTPKTSPKADLAESARRPSECQRRRRRSGASRWRPWCRRRRGRWCR